MSHRRLCLAAVVVLAVPGVAFAQGAPGNCQECFGVAPPMAAPEPAPELSNRIGVGVHVASLAIANKLDPDAPTELAGGGLQVRYRASSRWELMLSLETLREHDDAGMAFGPELQSATVGAMYHLRPLQRWDVYLLGAIGTVASHDETGRVVDAERGQAHLGIGLERRWRRLGISAELRGVGIAPVEAAASTTDPSFTPRPGGPTTAPAPANDEGDQGALVSLSATYFF